VINAQRLQEFVQSYFGTFAELSAKVKNEDRQLLFPKYLSGNYLAKCTISRRNGAAIEFLEKEPPLVVEVNYVDDDIEYVVFPRMSGRKPLFLCKGENTIIRNLNIITKSYYNVQRDSIEALSRSTNLVTDFDLESFIRIEKGDIRLIDVGIAYEADGICHAKKIDCLWLIAENSETYLTMERARELASYDYNSIVSQALGGVPIAILIDTLQEYQKLLQRLDVRENVIQEFLERNFIILEPSYKMALTKDDLRKLKLPEADFLLKSSEGNYVIIELESPQDNLFTNETPPNPSRELRNTQSQMQNYLSFFKNNILYCKQHFPDMMVEKVTGLIVIGRGNNLTQIQKDSLQKILGTVSAYGIITYDDLFEKTKLFLENLSIRYGQFS